MIQQSSSLNYEPSSKLHHLFATLGATLDPQPDTLICIRCYPHICMHQMLPIYTHQVLLMYLHQVLPIYRATLVGLGQIELRSYEMRTSRWTHLDMWSFKSEFCSTNHLLTDNFSPSRSSHLVISKLDLAKSYHSGPNEEPRFCRTSLDTHPSDPPP